MDFLETILGVAMFLFGVFIVGCSYVRQYHNYKNRNRPGAPHSSPAPVVGPIFIIFGLKFAGVEPRMWFWFFFLLDPDTVVAVLSLPVFLREILTRS